MVLIPDMGTNKPFNSSMVGKEKNFSFETLVYVKKDGDDYQLYLRPEEDPILQGTPIDMWFRTE